ncbi:MAG: hypothetical protein DRP42_04110 [Tenericutes bacterium]|nr:MAG: hypothetical protein DRP42_04110 [Mycoplasmatota bacterium]
METAITFVREWILVKKATRTNDNSLDYDPLDQEFSEGILEILTDDLGREEAVEELDTLFASKFEYKHPRWMDLFLDVRQMVQPEKVEIVEEKEKSELIGISP